MSEVSVVCGKTKRSFNVRDIYGDTPLHVAARCCNVAVLPHLLAVCDVNAVNSRDKTPCFLATGTYNEKKYRTLELLLDAGADVNFATGGDFFFRRESAGSIALSLNDDRALELFVDAGLQSPNTLQTSENGWTAMHVAARGCNHRLLAKLIAADGGDVNLRGQYRDTPLHLLAFAPESATEDDALQTVSLLLAANADIHVRDREGLTPLHCVTRRGFSDCVSLLIKAGAKVNARNKVRQTPLHFATDVDSATALIAAKANVTAVTDTGFTACHTAWHSAPLLSLLIAAGADPLRKDHEGATALHVAAGITISTTDVLSLLIDAGADVNQRNDAGDSAAHEAARVGNVDNLRFLLARGARVDERMLLLTAAAHEGAVESLRVLVDAGVDVHAIGEGGATVAHGANARVLPFLHSQHVNLSAADDLGCTPCHAASSNAVLMQLFAFGATMAAVNGAGETPFETYLAKCKVQSDRDWDDAVLTFVAAGLGVGVSMTARRSSVCAMVSAGGGQVSPRARADDDEGEFSSYDLDNALRRIQRRQLQLFRMRAVHVCVALHALRISALEMCEILSFMFAPLESFVPFRVAWRVVCAVKHARKH